MKGAPWAKVASDLLSHPKVVALEKRLDDPRAAFFLVATWLHFARFYCDGSMPDTPEKRVALAEAARWPPMKGDMVEALVATSFLRLRRNRIVVHGWEEWTGTYYAKLVRDRAGKRAKRANGNGMCRATAHDVAPKNEKQTENKNKTETERSLSSEPRSEPAATSPILLKFDCVGTGAKWHHVTAANVAGYRVAYPALDVEGELRRMQVWLDSNPTKRKTAKGMPRFIAAWLGRAQDRGRPGAGGKPRVIGEVGVHDAASEAAFREVFGEKP